ncbi:hypothetical protein BC940DRAFT_301127 [Gongronella butleri]|nr:hypothetical protein BC940DRAFT_301127 [Gongronella butleri]
MSLSNSELNLTLRSLVHRLECLDQRLRGLQDGHMELLTSQAAVLDHIARLDATMATLAYPTPQVAADVVARHLATLPRLTGMAAAAATAPHGLAMSNGGVGAREFHHQAGHQHISPGPDASKPATPVPSRAILVQSTSPQPSISSLKRHSPTPTASQLSASVQSLTPEASTARPQDNDNTQNVANNPFDAPRNINGNININSSIKINSNNRRSSSRISTKTDTPVTPIVSSEASITKQTPDPVATLAVKASKEQQDKGDDDGDRPRPAIMSNIKRTRSNGGEKRKNDSSTRESGSIKRQKAPFAAPKRERRQAAAIAASKIVANAVSSQRRGPGPSQSPAPSNQEDPPKKVVAKAAKDMKNTPKMITKIVPADPIGVKYSRTTITWILQQAMDKAPFTSTRRANELCDSLFDLFKITYLRYLPKDIPSASTKWNDLDTNTQYKITHSYKISVNKTLGIDLTKAPRMLAYIAYRIMYREMLCARRQAEK